VSVEVIRFVESIDMYAIAGYDFTRGAGTGLSTLSYIGESNHGVHLSAASRLQVTPNG
jgi:hypothetical protein